MISKLLYITFSLIFILNLSVFSQKGGKDKITHPAPTPDFAIEGLCKGDTATFINRTGNGATFFEWFIIDENKDTLVSSTETHPKVLFPSAGTYTVHLNAYNGHFASIKREITVDSVFSMAFSYKVPCIGFSTLFINKCNCATSYEWKFGDGQSSTESNPVYQYTSPKRYKVILVAYDKQGQADTITQEVSTYEGAPDPFYSYTKTGDTFHFAAPDTNIVNYLWYFGDGDTSIEASPKHVYKDAALYPVFLTAWNPCGIDYYLDNVGFMVSVPGHHPQDHEVLVYPTSASKEIHLKFYTQSADQVSIRLFNTNGQMVYNTTIDRIYDYSVKTIDVSRNASGIYLLEVRYPDAVLRKKLIIH